MGRTITEEHNYIGQSAESMSLWSGAFFPRGLLLISRIIAEMSRCTMVPSKDPVKMELKS